MNEFDGYFLNGMARALWVHAFMDWAQEVDPPPVLGEGTWEQEAPDTPQTRSASRKAARDLTRILLEGNDLDMRSLASLFHTQDQKFMHSPVVRERARSAPEDRALYFGEDVALAALGVRESPLPGQLRIPEFKVSLDDDGHALSWDGGWTWHKNPAPRWPSSSVQSLLFSRRMYSADKAKRWASKHGFKHGAVEVTDNYIRLRQFDPNGRPCRTVTFDGDIKAIVCATSNPSIGGPEVLLLDASPKQQIATTRLLKKALSSPQIIVADNVGAAIANMEVHEFTYIVSDVSVLGNRTGIDFYEYLRRERPGAIPGFLFFTDALPASEYPRILGARVMLRAGATPERLRALLLRGAVACLVAGGEAPPKQRQMGWESPIPPRAVAQDDEDDDEDKDVDAQMGWESTVPPRATRRDTPLTQDEIIDAVIEVMPKIVQAKSSAGRAVGRFGSKVFVAAIWRQLEDDPRFAQMASSGGAGGQVPPPFKVALLKANRDRRIVLTRADLVGAMDPGEVAASEIADRGATFHFVMLPGSGW